MLVISLHQTPACLQEIWAHFPQAEVFAATDFREQTARSLYDEGRITLSTMDTIERGRRWHKEIPRPAAVGLFDSHVQALRSVRPGHFLLLCEDDCAMDAGIGAKVAALLRRPDDFDVAIFGPTVHGELDMLDELPGWGRLRQHSSFWCTHCVLYSPRGRERALSLLRYPIEMQIDTMITLLARQGELTLVLEAHPHTARQRMHWSSLQDMCIVCDAESHIRFTSNIAIGTMLMLFAFVVTAVVVVANRGVRHRTFCTDACPAPSTG